MFLPVDTRPARQGDDNLLARLDRFGTRYRYRSLAHQKMQAGRWHAFDAGRLLDRVPKRMPSAREVYDYAFDTVRRSVLFWDVLRRRGNEFLEYEASGQPPLLAFDYEVLVDGRDLPDPVNYCLVRIVPPKGTRIDPKKRPYFIIDPRAGHGAGIGGFKQESQVGVALREGHPVYFSVFYPEPVPGQSLRSVAAAESGFVREVVSRHPDSPKPCIVGNCQGGWAVMGLAAADPDITGPLVLNGAPLSYWSGVYGKSPMRYLGGLAGGSWPAYLMSDLGNGTFDGAWLVQNFEGLNPANTLWTKYFRLYSNIDTEVQRFLDFEKWWGGFVFMTAEEMRDIVDDLFVGNKLATGGIPLGRGMMLDLRQVRSPIVVFCSHGDDITPPQQALNWIADTYMSAREIKAYGQTIVYIIHAETGHLGIFVSGSVVKREFSEIAGTLAAIEALPPGLYEMVIEDAPLDSRGIPRYEVSLHEREIEDILCHDDTREDEHHFRAVAGLSELNGKLYDLFVSPWVRAMTNETTARVRRRLHPMRMQRYLWSDLNPALWWLPFAAHAAKQLQPQLSNENPLPWVEQFASGLVEASLDAVRDMRDMSMELAFHGLYDFLDLVGVSERLAARTPESPAARHDVSALALERINEGGVREAVTRMLLLLMKVAGSVRRETPAYVQAQLREVPEFADTDATALRAMLATQSTIVAYQPEEALLALPLLLPRSEERRQALAILHRVLPDNVHERPALCTAMRRFEEVLGESGEERKRRAASNMRLV